MWFGRITLDPVRGTIVNETLAMIERELFEIDWAQAKDHLGRKPTLDDLPRTPAQRRADALTEMRSEDPTSELQSLMRISYAASCLKRKTSRTTVHKKQKAQ